MVGKFPFGNFHAPFLCLIVVSYGSLLLLHFIIVVNHCSNKYGCSFRCHWVLFLELEIHKGCWFWDPWRYMPGMVDNM